MFRPKQVSEKGSDSYKSILQWTLTSATFYQKTFKYIFDFNFIGTLFLDDWLVNLTV